MLGNWKLDWGKGASGSWGWTLFALRVRRRSYLTGIREVAAQET